MVGLGRNPNAPRELPIQYIPMHHLFLVRAVEVAHTMVLMGKLQSGQLHWFDTFLPLIVKKPSSFSAPHFGLSVDEKEMIT